jgi:hypothetical protein
MSIAILYAPAGCGPDANPTPAAAGQVPAGSGYDDLRLLSRDDCVMLRDHQLEIAVEAALAPDGGSELLDAGEKLTLEAALRLKAKQSTDAWIGRCSGRMVPASDLRCMREATTPEAFNACGDLGEDGDAGSDAASDGPADATPGG